MDLPGFTNNATDEQIVRIKEELGEDDDRFSNNLQLLTNWMECHPFIPKNYDKEMLPIFARSCKHNMEKTKKKLEFYFVYKTRYPEAFTLQQFVREEEKRVLKNFYCYPSKNLTCEGYVVFHMGFRNLGLSDVDTICKVIFMIATFKANKSRINAGDVIVLNCSVCSPGLASQFVTPTFKRTMEMVQKIYPYRIKAIYITHVPGYAMTFINVAKMFFNEKIRKRISVETGNEYMKKCLPEYCIPKDFGGRDISVEEGFNNSTQFLNSYETWFREHDKVQAFGEIPKEVYAASGINEETGTHGTFRQLTVD